MKRKPKAKPKRVYVLKRGTKLLAQFVAINRRDAAELREPGEIVVVCELRELPPRKKKVKR